MAIRVFALTLTLTATATADDLSKLRERVAEDLRHGKPLVIETHVALCSNDQIRCGGRGLGDGDDLSRNLYWATSGGLRGWFERRGSDWKRLSRERGDGKILETVTYTKQQTPSEAWRALGVSEPFEVRLIAHAWRGREIDRALDAFAGDLTGDGAAQIVAYVGHNGWMDRAEQRWPSRVPRRDKGAIAIACMTQSYLQKTLFGPRRLPLLATRDLLFAGSHALDGAVRAFAAGEPLDEIRLSAARAYAEGEGKPMSRARAVFTNPGDPRWR
jgi:hypothetical protein